MSQQHRSTPPSDVGSPVSPTVFAVSLVIAMTMVTGALVSFVRMKSTQIEVGYRIHDLRSRLVTLDQQRAALDVERSALSRPSRLAHIARTNLGLVPADASMAATARSINPPAIVGAP